MSPLFTHPTTTSNPTGQEQKQQEKEELDNAANLRQDLAARQLIAQVASNHATDDERRQFEQQLRTDLSFKLEVSTEVEQLYAKRDRRSHNQASRLEAARICVTVGKRALVLGDPPLDPPMRAAPATCIDHGPAGSGRASQGGAESRGRIPAGRATQGGGARQGPMATVRAKVTGCCGGNSRTR